MTLSRAEQVALSLVAVLTAGVILPYLSDAIGFGVQPVATVAAAIFVGIAVALRWQRDVKPERIHLLILTGLIAATTSYLLWLAWPSLLPPGGGPDLTHHLVLVDYIERHGSLAHEPDANGLLGEMADYTPGLHLLAVLAGALTRTNGFFAVYPVLAITVSIKAGVFFLILLRLLTHHQHRTLLALCGVGLLFHASPYTVYSFTHDSFLAQVASELFAIVMWWAVVVWWQEPRRDAAIVFGGAGAAAFLTWPIWIGPPVLTFFIVVLLRHDLALAAKARDLAVAFAPIAAVALLHTFGRSAALSIAGTSGAVVAPALVGWWLLILAALGLVIAATNRRFITLLIFTAAVVLQAGALLVVARQSGAHTPYMAIKMTYLAIYPLLGGAVVCLSLVANSRLIAVAAVVLIGASAARGLSTEATPTPVVSRDLWTAGRWARQRLAPSCVDYLAGNADTAYWLHLAVVGNRRASERTANDDTFAIQRAVERWLTRQGPPYAIADVSVLPVDLHDRSRVVYQVGSAAVLQRLEATQTEAADDCIVSNPSATF